MKKFAIPLFLFLFLVSSASAFSNFNYNPYFTNDTLGVASYGTNPVNVSHNSTCSGLNGCLIAESNGTATHFILAVLSEPYESNTDNFTVFGEYFDNYYMTIPQNSEGILSFSYRLNATITTPQPVLKISVAGIPTIAITLNSTPNVWHNVSYIIPSDTAERAAYAFIDIYFDNAATMLMIDKFNLYTFDAIEARSTWTTNSTEELIRYGGSNAVWLCNGVNTPLNTLPNFFIAKNGTTAQLYGKGENNYSFIAVKMGNMTLVRRVLQEEMKTAGAGYEDTARLIKTRDFYLIRNGVWTGGNPCDNAAPLQIQNIWVMEGLSITTAKITTLYNNSSGAGSFIYPNTNLTIMWMIGNNSNAVRSSISTIPYLNTSSPAGTLWQIYISSVNTTYHEFFSPSTLLCEGTLICDQATNYQYYQTMTCDVVNAIWCGSWYCKPDLSGCNFGVIGSYCLGDNYSYITTDINGSQSFGNCYPEYCYNLTSNTTACYSPSEYAAWVKNNITANVANEPAKSAAMWFASLFNIDDESVAKAFFSLFISLGIAIVAMFYSRNEKEMAGKVFIGVFLIILTGFTIIGWFYWYLYIILLVIVVGIITGVIKKLIGGG